MTNHLSASWLTWRMLDVSSNFNKILLWEKVGESGQLSLKQHEIRHSTSYSDMFVVTAWALDYRMGKNFAAWYAWHTLLLSDVHCPWTRDRREMRWVFIKARDRRPHVESEKVWFRFNWLPPVCCVFGVQTFNTIGSLTKLIMAQRLETR